MNEGQVTIKLGSHLREPVRDIGVRDMFAFCPHFPFSLLNF